ncbi:MAG TPA: lysozyme [Flexivirga sp.]|uniref:lysozyme n=1 Tax=Flexivirga sp. TaxID=1962927 RepID=UPI002C3B4C73|nr:lysozyme [Flexivirga sp.]HWC24814.1 lysozyme [Flexivirga sp.]
MKKSLPIATAATATVAAVALAATALPAQATPNSPEKPTRAAQNAGIHKMGDAYAGWHQPKSAGPMAAGLTRAVSPAMTATKTLGIDVSAYQGNVDWSAQYSSGVRWAYTKATEGDYYTNAYFAQQYNGSYNAGIIRGAYHFANPAGRSASAQADYFVNHGGGWSRDGKTMPGMLDIEYNPYGSTCYGLSKSAMVTWIKTWLARYKALTSRDAVIYTTAGWWSTCTGNSTAFNQTNPLWIARYASSPGTLPGGWLYYTMWQYTSSPIDKNLFNGDLSRVKALAYG